MAVPRALLLFRDRFRLLEILDAGLWQLGGVFGMSLPPVLLVSSMPDGRWVNLLYTACPLIRIASDANLISGI